MHISEGTHLTDEQQGSAGSNSGTLFSGLMNQKRNSGDAAAQARRQSFNEQKPASGIIGNMWNKYVSLRYIHSEVWNGRLTESVDSQQEDSSSEVYERFPYKEGCRTYGVAGLSARCCWS